MKTKPQVQNADASEIPAREIQEAILRIGQGMRALSESRLNDTALVTLLADSTKVSKGTIKEVLKGLKELESTYLKPVRAARS